MIAASWNAATSRSGCNGPKGVIDDTCRDTYDASDPETARKWKKKTGNLLIILPSCYCVLHAACCVPARHLKKIFRQGGGANTYAMQLVV